MIIRVSPNSSIRTRSPKAILRAFTLVELLVVIGIIALLISILLPALSSARQAALKVACGAKLHTIMLASQLHLNDHHGYYPLAGVLPGYTPSSLDDAYSQRYDYEDAAAGFGAGYFQSVQPITIALAGEMSAHKLDALTNAAIGLSETDSAGWIKNFLCPAQATDTKEINCLPLLYQAEPSTLAYTEAESYIFNEVVVGWDPYNTTLTYPVRLGGRAAGIHQVATTMYAADGLMGSNPSSVSGRSGYGAGMMTLTNIANVAPLTMADAYRGIGRAGDAQNFDKVRHRGKINVAFCDGHVENRTINLLDLAKVYLLPP